MKRFLLFLVCVLIFPCCCLANTQEQDILNDMQIQNRISDIGFKILNANKIDVRMAFVYNKKEKKKSLSDPALSRRHIVMYKNDIQFADSDDEIAAFLARKICKGGESYTGAGNGIIGSAQVKFAPKKYEMFFDERAVDFMVKAGYNPLALITYIEKSHPEERFYRLFRHNKASKRLANIYEHIYWEYPSFLADNKYINNEYYQHFLLSSVENRKKLYDKIESEKRYKIKYE